MDMQVFHGAMQVDYVIWVLGDLDKIKWNIPLADSSYIQGFCKMWQRPEVTHRCLGILQHTGCFQCPSLALRSILGVDPLIYITGMDIDVCLFDWGICWFMLMQMCMRGHSEKIWWDLMKLKVYCIVVVLWNMYKNIIFIWNFETSTYIHILQLPHM